MRWRHFSWMAIWAASLLAMGSVQPATGQEKPPPADVLAGKGLTRVDRVWMTPQELQLRQELAELPKRRERILAIERELDQRIEQNRVAWQENQPALTALKQALGKLGTGDPQRAAIQRQVETIEAATPEPARLGTRGDIRAKVIEWTSERNELSAAATKIRETLPKLIEQYAELAKDAEVQRSVRQVGENQRLGPQRTYQGDVQKLADYERLVHTRWNPIHWQAGQVRLTALVDEQSPLTFCWIEASQQTTLITSTAAEAASIKIPDDAPRESITLSPGREVSARRVSIPYLRFGGCVLRGTTALVLPPEAEDWGSRIGRDALAEHVVKLEPERLRLWIDGQ